MHYLYETTNNMNKMIYIGVHTGSINDDYLGSGKYLNRAINKYGTENFTKLCLFVGRSREITYWVEKMIVDKEFVESKSTYNLKVGGYGGFDYINKNCHPKRGFTKEEGEYANQRKRELWKHNKEWATKYRINHSIAQKRFYENGGVNGFKNKTHSEETREKIKEEHKKNKHQQGSKNSQFGTMWITNEIESKKIPKGQEIPDGWRKGRKIKIGD